MSASPPTVAERGRQRLRADACAGGEEVEEEWEEVNRLLRGQGLGTVRVRGSRRHANSAGDDVVLDARELRRTLQTLLRDAERRQHLIQDLVLTNNRLTADLRAQQARVQSAEERLRKLERAQERDGSGKLGSPQGPPIKEHTQNRRPPRVLEGGSNPRGGGSSPHERKGTAVTHGAARRRNEGEGEHPAGNGWEDKALTGAQGPAWGASRAVLAGLVSAVQRLFEVRSLGGVYPHLHTMYMRLGEMNNAVRTLKQLLSLDEAAPVGAVVDAVGRLCIMPGKLTCSQRSSQTSPGSDCTRAWLELYEEFFPAFQQLVQQLKDTLGIDSLDAILPTIQRLKAESRGRPSR